MRWIELLLALGLLTAVALMSRVLVTDFRNGVVRRSFVTYTRAAHPRTFWIWTVINLSLFAIFDLIAFAAFASVAIQFFK